MPTFRKHILITAVWPHKARMLLAPYKQRLKLPIKSTRLCYRCDERQLSNQLSLDETSFLSSCLTILLYFISEYEYTINTEFKENQTLSTNCIPLIKPNHMKCLKHNCV